MKNINQKTTHSHYLQTNPPPAAGTPERIKKGKKISGIGTRPKKGAFVKKPPQNRPQYNSRMLKAPHLNPRAYIYRYYNAIVGPIFQKPRFATLGE